MSFHGFGAGRVPERQLPPGAWCLICRAPGPGAQRAGNRAAGPESQALVQGCDRGVPRPLRLEQANRPAAPGGGGGKAHSGEGVHGLQGPP